MSDAAALRELAALLRKAAATVEKLAEGLSEHEATLCCDALQPFANGLGSALLRLVGDGLIPLGLLAPKGEKSPAN